MIKNLQECLLFGLCAALLSACTLDAAAPGPAEQGEMVRSSTELPSKSPARTSAKAHVELGNVYMQNGSNGVALDEARMAISADSSYAPAHLLMAMVYASQEQFALARPAFEEASRLAPGDPVINDAFGWFLCSQGQESAGLVKLEMAARNPYYQTPTRAWTNAGWCLLRKKDDAGAEDRLLRAVQVDSGNAAALVSLADIAFRTTRFLRAKQLVDMAQQKMSRSNVEVLWLATRIEQKLGNKDVVQSYGSKMRNEFPGSNEYQLYLQGKFE
jgi:type IV pilus assembly protein PilF